MNCRKAGEPEKRKVTCLQRMFEASKDIEITERYIEELLDKVEKKSDYPKSGSPLYYENTFTGYYFVVFKAYLAFYRLEKETMLIDRILFGKSDYMRILNVTPF